jgi:hypothetical protein
MIDPNLIQDFLQKVKDYSPQENSPNEVMTLREYSRRAKRLKLKTNPPQ